MKFLKDANAQIQQIGFTDLFPYPAWLKDEIWGEAWIRWFMFLSLCPLLLAYLITGLGLSLQSVAWLFGLYFSVIWGLAIKRILDVERAPVGRAVKISLFTIVVGVFFVLIAQQFPVINTLYLAAQSGLFPARVFGFVFGVGLTEEIAKAFPIAWLFLYKGNKSPVNVITFLGCASGFAFGIAEASSYSISNTIGLLQGALGFNNYLTVQLVRVITLPLLHAVFTGIVAYFIGLAAEHRRFMPGLIVTGVGLAAALHGFYDVFADSIIGLGISVFAVFCFIAYSRSASHITERIAEIEAGNGVGLSRESRSGEAHTGPPGAEN